MHNPKRPVRIGVMLAVLALACSSGQDLTGARGPQPTPGQALQTATLSLTDAAERATHAADFGDEAPLVRSALRSAARAMAADDLASARNALSQVARHIEAPACELSPDCTVVRLAVYSAKDALSPLH